MNTAISDLMLPAATDSGTVVYSLTPALPAGLEPAGGVTGAANPPTIRGTPSATSPSTTYTYTATDASSNPTTITFTIIVNEAETFETGKHKLLVHLYPNPVEDVLHLELPPGNHYGMKF